MAGEGRGGDCHIWYMGTWARGSGGAVPTLRHPPPSVSGPRNLRCTNLRLFAERLQARRKCNKTPGKHQFFEKSADRRTIALMRRSADFSGNRVFAGFSGGDQIQMIDPCLHQKQPKQQTPRVDSELRVARSSCGAAAARSRCLCVYIGSNVYGKFDREYYTGLYRRE